MVPEVVEDLVPEASIRKTIKATRARRPDLPQRMPPGTPVLLRYQVLLVHMCLSCAGNAVGASGYILLRTPKLSTTWGS
jgi:hypothetical protein